MIWSIPADFPVAQVERGEWGDSYTAIEIVGESDRPGSITGELRLKAVRRVAAYGAIPEDVAAANGRFIETACNSHDALLAACKELLGWVEDDYGLRGDVIEEAYADSPGCDGVVFRARGAIALAEKLQEPLDFPAAKATI